MPGKKPYKAPADKTSVKRSMVKNKMGKDPDKGKLNEGSRLPVGMRSNKFERENMNREIAEREFANSSDETDYNKLIKRKKSSDDGHRAIQGTLDKKSGQMTQYKPKQKKK